MQSLDHHIYVCQVIMQVVKGVNAQDGRTSAPKLVASAGRGGGDFARLPNGEIREGEGR
jgi:hypothetical protein